VSGRASGVKMVGMVQVRAPISLDGVAVDPDCWRICLCYLHFAPENPEGGKMYLLVLAHPGCPGHSPESHKNGWSSKYEVKQLHVNVLMVAPNINGCKLLHITDIKLLHSV